MNNLFINIHYYNFKIYLVWKLLILKKVNLNILYVRNNLAILIISIPEIFLSNLFTDRYDYNFYEPLSIFYNSVLIDNKFFRYYSIKLKIFN